MITRYRPSPEEPAAADKARPVQRAGLYHIKQAPTRFIHTGCTLLDCVIGGGGRALGGWALGRIANIVGDKSVGKTLLGIEATANFARQYPKGLIAYREAEAAFDVDYAGRLGLPLKRVDFGPEGIDTNWDTIEAIFDDLDAFLEKCAKAKQPGLYIIDSLDALSSEAELKRKIRDGTYGTDKARKLSEMFRRLNRRVKRSEVCVIFISQIRDNIDAVGYGKKYTRAGGKSLDFYASVVIYLSHLGQIPREINKIKRIVGVEIKAKCEKNKISEPFHDCMFGIRFGYGIDDEAACVAWLKSVDKLQEAGLPEKFKISELDPDKLKTDVRRIWAEIDAGFAPEQRKYG